MSGPFIPPPAALALLVEQWEDGGRVGPDPRSARARFERGEDPVGGDDPTPPHVTVRTVPLVLPPWTPPRSR